MMTGLPFMGYIIGAERLDCQSALNLFLTLVASYLLLVHVFALNDSADFIADGKDPQRTRNCTIRPAVSQRIILIISLSSGIASLLLLSVLRMTSFIPAVLIMLASFIYSWPTVLWGKNTPFLSTALHFVGGASLYAIGHLVAASYWQFSSVGLALFFGFSLSAGHVFQEIGDHDIDTANRIKTHSTMFGQESAYWFGQFNFTVAFLVLALLSIGEHIVLPISIIGAFLVFIWMFSWKLRILSFSREACNMYRVSYNLAYALLCILLATEAPSISLLSL